MQPQDVQAYLLRIGMVEPAAPTREHLFALQRAHLFHVPFENLDIHLGRAILLEERVLFQKIVRQRRGGFCFELNGCFASLLEALGFAVYRLSASSANDDGTYLPAFEHLALEVHAVDQPDAAWLVDVGWGDGPLEPLRIIDGLEQPGSDGRIFRLQQDGEYWILAEKTQAGAWLTHYRFDRLPHALAEFQPMCAYLQTSPESIFTQKRLCTIFSPGGRDTLTERRLIESRGAGLRGAMQRTERDLPDEAEYRQVLLDQFGIQWE